MLILSVLILVSCRFTEVAVLKFVFGWCDNLTKI